MSRASGDAKQIRVITVHGGADPGAKWDDPSSLMVRTLSETMAAHGAEAQFRNFEWSGQNSHDARRAAAEALAMDVESDLSQGYDDVFIVSHGHGGAVARLAMNLMPGTRRPSGVLTFGASFLRFRPRWIGAATNAMMWLTRALGVAVSALILVLLFLPDAGTEALGDAAAQGDAADDTDLYVDDARRWMVFGGLSIALAATIGLTLAADWLIRRWRGYLLAKRDYLTSTFDPTERLPVGYVCYQAIGDESAAMMRLWRFFSWLMQTAIFSLIYGAIVVAAIGVAIATTQVVDAFGVSLWRDAMAWPVEAAAQALARLGLIVDPAAALAGERLDQTLGMLPATLSIAIVGALAVLVALALVAAPFALALPWLLRGQNIAFGGEDPSWSLVTDIGVDRLPGRRSLMKRKFFPQAYLNRSSQHHFYYLDPAVLQDVALEMLNWNVPDRRFHVDLERTIAEVLRLGIPLCVFVGSFVVAVYFALPA